MKLSILVTAFVLLSVGCSQNDLARLIEPRKHKSTVVYKKPIVKRPPVQRVVYVRPRKHVRKAIKTPTCSYVVRDLSRPGSTKVWCHPGRSR